MDGDGDLDVLSASWNGDEIAWYEQKPSPVLAAVTVSGDAAVLGETVHIYSCTAHFSDGSPDLDVSTDPACIWTIVGASYGATLAGNQLTAGHVSEPRTIMIRAEYTDGGVTKADTLEVMVLPTSGKLSGTVYDSSTGRLAVR